MTVQIITDSGSDLTPALASAYGVTVVPLQVLLGGVNYRDGVDLSPAEFYAQMRRAKELPKTSQPVPQELIAAYRAAVERGPVLSIHLSANLSGTFQTATMAARTVSDSIWVFDSRSGSGGLALQVLEAARLAREGASVETIIATLEMRRTEIHTLVALSTLENAVKGGRVSPVAGMAASLLGVKPIVHVTRDGRVEPIDRVRGRGRALERLLEMAAKLRTEWTDRPVVVAHGNCREDAEAFARSVRERFAPGELMILPIGATVGTYAAEGAILFSF